MITFEVLDPDCAQSPGLWRGVGFKLKVLNLGMMALQLGGGVIPQGLEFINRQMG